mgnify:CR=1 FL=1
MLGYVCKYTPMELFEAMDTEITRVWNHPLRILTTRTP